MATVWPQYGTARAVLSVVVQAKRHAGLQLPRCRLCFPTKQDADDAAPFDLDATRDCFFSSRGGSSRFVLSCSPLDRDLLTPLAWAGHIGDATSAYHLEIISPPGLKIEPSRYGGEPWKRKIWAGGRVYRVCGSCKPHLLRLRACTYLYKMPASTSPSLTSGPERSTSSTRALLIRLQGPQVPSCYWLW